MPLDLLPAIARAMACAGIAAMFASAALAKLRHDARWLGAVAGYRLLPDFAVRPVAWALPPAEMMVAAALLLPIAQSAGIAGAIGLLALFAAAMAFNLLRGRRDVDCGCDPAARAKPIAWGMVARNAGLALVLAMALLPMPALPLPMHIAATFAGGVALALVRSVALIRSFAPVTSGVR